MTSQLRLQRFADVDSFLAAASAFLVERETEHNLMLGICSNLQAFAAAYPEPPYFSLVRDDERPVLAVVWTPPWQVVLSCCDDPGAIPLALEDLADRAPSGVHGAAPDATAFAEGWAIRSGDRVEVSMRELGYRLERLIEPPVVSGRARRATADDRALLVDWIVAFEHEVFGEPQPRDPAAWVDLALDGRGRELHLWDDGGPVSLCGAGGRTPNGIRIGPVYTPPEVRRRGFASALVASVTRDHLTAGRRFVFLMADAANPTSNHVYQAIGFEPVTEIAEFRFRPTVLPRTR